MTDTDLLIESFDNMEVMINKLKETISSSLDVIKADAIELSKTHFDGSDLNSRIKSLFGPQLKSEKIQYEFSGEKVKLNTDRSLVESIVENLVSNSIKYKDETKDSYIKINLKQSENEYILSVEDNGLGINKRFHENLFSMFTRFHNVSDGTGLGLYNLKKTVERLKGELSFESEEGKGSTFKVILPQNQ